MTTKTTKPLEFREPKVGEVWEVMGTVYLITVSPVTGGADIAMLDLDNLKTYSMRDNATFVAASLQEYYS